MAYEDSSAWLADVDFPALLGVMDAVLTLLIAASVALIAWRVFQFDKARALQNDREQLRQDLRAWFQTLSRSAPRRVRARGGSLRAKCEEVADAEGAREILTLMLWAQDMLDESYRQVASGTLTSDAAHDRRIIVKRRFRECIAVWSRHQRRGRRHIDGYTGRGWAAIMNETLASAGTAYFLSRRETWRKLPVVWATTSYIDTSRIGSEC